MTYQNLVISDTFSNYCGSSYVIFYTTTDFHLEMRKT